MKTKKKKSPHDGKKNREMLANQIKCVNFAHGITFRTIIRTQIEQDYILYIMRIALLQTNISWMDEASNMMAAAAMMDKAGNADLYVLPEMWSTGFVTDVEEARRLSSATTDQSTALVWMKEQSRNRNAAVCGSLAVRDEEGKMVNRHYFVQPDGKSAFYDKRHLFRMGGEDKAYSRGTRPCVVPFRGVRFMLSTCYDLRFPVWLRNTSAYDVLLCVANWPESRKHVWETLLKARAIENQCFVAGCNRTGDDTACHYGGRSMVIDARGKIIADAGSEDNAVVACDINMEQLSSFRSKFPVLNDRDEFEII